MRIRTKVILFVLGVSMASAGTAYFVQHAIMFPGFLRVEHEAAVDGLSRFRQALERDAKFLADSAGDYGGWDETYRFIEDLNDEYESENLTPETFVNLHLNLCAVVRLDRTIAWAQIRDDDGALVEAPALLAQITAANSGLVSHTSTTSKRSGILQTQMGPMLLGSAAITTTDRSGPIRGAMIMGRMIDATTVEELVDRTRVKGALHVLNAVPPEDTEALKHLSGGSPMWTRRAAGALQMFTFVPDFTGKPALLLRADQPLTISRRGEEAARLAVATSMGGGALLAAVMWFGLSHMLIGPLTRVTRHAVQVGATSNLTARLNMQGKDEISVLAREFDAMVDRLAEARAQMLDVAHSAGKSEVARSVLHNIGNVLNTVNVSAGTVMQRLRNSEVETLGQAARMVVERRDDLAAFVTQDERGKHLPAFLDEMARHLADEQQSLLGEMNTLCEALGHIRGVLETEQHHARAQGVIERLAPDKVAEQALTLVGESLTRHAVRVERDFATHEAVDLDRHRVLQILVNLLSNAIQAVKTGREQDRCITLAVRQDSAQQRITFMVRDNGDGIAPANIERIFAAGFSTRPGGSGLGLHSAANLAREMGGELTGASDGAGRGATFTLSLPTPKECKL